MDLEAKVFGDDDYKKKDRKNAHKAFTNNGRDEAATAFGRRPVRGTLVSSERKGAAYARNAIHGNSTGFVEPVKALGALHKRRSRGAKVNR